MKRVHEEPTRTRETAEHPAALTDGQLEAVAGGAVPEVPGKRPETGNENRGTPITSPDGFLIGAESFYELVRNVGGN